jgi:hypothetical protein
MSPSALLALVPVLMLTAMFIYEATHAKGALVRVRSDGRRAR